MVIYICFYMNIKNQYHPAIVLAFYLGFLTDDVLLKIPRSTKSDWKTKQNNKHLFGNNWGKNNQHIFDTISAVAQNQHLLKVNKALIRIIAIKHFMQRYAQQIKDKISFAPQTLLANIIKTKNSLGLTKTLQLLQMPYAKYLSLRRTNCNQSTLHLCLLKNPHQLLKNEVNVIKEYSTKHQYLLWSWSSIYHQIIKDKRAFFSLATFYKYLSVLKLKTTKIKHKKSRHSGLRASKTLQILHADATILTLADNSKAYIYFVQDNFSRMILSYRIALKCMAKYVFENLQEVNNNFLKPNNISHCSLVTDGGSENFGDAHRFCNNHFIEHIIAQKDIVQSNSMIEAANKQLKYRFLYHHKIADFDELTKYIKLAIDDYNNRPHHVLNGLTPQEVMNGKMPKNVNYTAQLQQAKIHRIQQNKQATCCVIF